MTSLVCSVAWAEEPKRVMLLHSFGRDFRPWAEYAKAIRAELEEQSPWPLDLHEHSLESARSSDQNSEGPFVEYLGALFAKRRLDLIVSIGAPAAAFVQRHREQLFPATPMVLTVVDQRRVRYSVLTSNDTVVAVAINYRAAFENILRVMPDTKNVAVVVGTSPIENYWREEIENEVRPLASRVAFTWYNNASFSEILKSAAALPPRSAIFWELMLVDAAGVVHEEGKALARLHAVANAPIFSYTDAFFGREIVGGPHVPVLEHGQQVARVAVRILGGEKAGEIKTPPTGFAAPKFDWRQMQRWGISASSLPTGSEILFRNPTIWQQYRWQIGAIAVLLVLETMLIGGLLYQRRRRHSAEVEARQRMAELAHMNRHATAGELSASIAHEVNQPLGSILCNTETVELMLDSASPDLEKIKELLADIKRDDQRASEVVRRLRRLLTKAGREAQDIDLNETVGEVLKLVSVQAAASNVALNSVLAPQAPQVSGDRIQIQQVILNLIINGMESMAGTSNGRREITSRTEISDQKAAEVSIYDSGPGIPPEKLGQVFEPFYTTKEQGMGIGLSIARTIIESHGGKIWAENRIGGGAVFRLSLPLTKAQ